MKKGRMVYVPPSILDAAEDLMRDKGYKKRTRAFDELAQHARVGIEAEKLYNLDIKGIFGKKVRRKK